LSEPDVTLTDYALAILCAGFAWACAQRWPSHALSRWFTVFFLAAAAAPLLGGTVHGFLADGPAQLEAMLWKATLLAMGAVALAGCAIGAHLLLLPHAAGRVIALASVATALYAGVVVLWRDEFGVAVAFYLPAALFLLVALVLSRRPGSPVAALGLGCTFVAAGIQQARLPLHPTYFDHNALYHLVQGVGLALIFVGGRRLVSRGEIHADAT
jgi:hypothetical protein